MCPEMCPGIYMTLFFLSCSRGRLRVLNGPRSLVLLRDFCFCVGLLVASFNELLNYFRDV